MKNYKLYKFLIFVIFFAILLYFLQYKHITNAKTSLEWAIYEKPLLVAVDVSDYNGDTLEAGRYKAEVREDGGVDKSEIFDIVVSDKELSISTCISIIRDAYSESYKSNVKDKFNHYAIGGLQDTPSSLVNLTKGQYVHIIPNTYYSIKRNLNNDYDYPSNLSGVFRLSKI